MFYYFIFDHKPLFSMVQLFSGNNKQGVTGLFIVAFIFVWCALNLKLLSPPKVIPASSTEEFSAERAMEFLKVIATEPHSAGTVAHGKVRDYILEFCKQQGLETELQIATGIQVWDNFARTGRAQNILARLKGTSSSKTILVMSHYDSQPNTPGASDDGAGVAAMMETIQMLKKGPPLKNDILFLFSDLEESALQGSEAFVSQYKNLNEIGLLLNFESRGNAGVSVTFEVSKNNRWLMEQYTTATGGSFANSIGYEIYKVMPNDSDFSMFRKTGIQGFNTAFIDGFTYYHSMADNVDNMDVRSLQNHGNVLFKSLKHFGNISLDIQAPKEDAIFFNPISNWLVIYPLYWDKVFIVLAILLFAIVFVVGIKKQRVSIKQTFVGIGLFLGFLLTSLAFVWLMEKVVLLVYPLYKNFDGFNSYNASYYLLSIVGLVLLSFSIWFSKVVSRTYFESYFLSGIIVLILIMITLKMAFPTGAYILHYPIIFSLGFYLVLLLAEINHENKPMAYGIIQILSFIPALSLWVPIAYLLFITFSHAMPFGAVVVSAFAIPLFIPSFRLIQKFHRWTVVAVSVSLIVMGFILGHIHSGYSKKEPLQTFLTYAFDADANKASWISEQRVPDEWTRQFIKSETMESVELYPNVTRMMWRADAPVITTGLGNVKILNDTLNAETRKLTLLITADSLTNSIDFTLPKSANILKINDRPLPEKVYRLSFWSMPAEGIEVFIEVPSGEELTLKLTERKIGLPKSLISQSIPENMIYGPGRLCNTIQVRRTIKL
jgi:hypothetical protein